MCWLGARTPNPAESLRVPIEQITEAMRKDGCDAWRRHKALGLPIVIRREGKVFEVPPSEIPT